MRINILLLFFITFLLQSCTPKFVKEYKKQLVEQPTEQTLKENNKILNYLIEKELDYKKTEDGIYYVIEKPGSSEKPMSNSKVTVHYKGYFLNGEEFDSSYKRDKPATFGLNQVIKGWTKSVPMLGIGGKGTFIIPSHLAYGGVKKGSIPPNSILAFDIELLDIFDPERQKKKDQELIQKYIKENQLSTKKTASGIHYVIEKQGKGTSPDVSSNVRVHYEGTLLDGKVFDSSYQRGEPIEFPLRNVIKGWQESVPLLKPGGKGKFLIPSHLAYGQRDTPSIPANSVLVFTIELLEPAKAPSGKNQAAIDHDLIHDYIHKKNLNVKKTASGIHYVIEKQGKGTSPNINSTVKVHYEGTLLDDTVFDSSYKRGEPIEFPLKNVIKGWQESVPLLKPGGKGLFIIPSELAYGARKLPSIPANSVLVFTVELLEIK